MLMKIVSPPNPSPVQTYPTREAALQSVGGALPPNRRVLPYAERDARPNAMERTPPSWVVVEYPAVVDGSELRDAAQYRVPATKPTTKYRSHSSRPVHKFGEWTGRNIGNYMAVVLNDEVKSAAYIRSQIFDQGEISGQFTKATADDLALTLRSGALPAKIEYLEERTVGPSLGADSIAAGLRASLGGLAFIIVFMLFYYRGSGVNAVIALILNMLLTGAAVVMFGNANASRNCRLHSRYRHGGRRQRACVRAHPRRDKGVFRFQSDLDGV